MARNVKKQMHCGVCRANQREQIDYKNVKLLKRYVSSFGKIVARKRSGLCSGCQRRIAGAVKQARIMALLPFVNK